MRENQINLCKLAFTLNNRSKIECKPCSCQLFCTYFQNILYHKEYTLCLFLPFFYAKEQRNAAVNSVLLSNFPIKLKYE